MLKRLIPIIMILCLFSLSTVTAQGLYGGLEVSYGIPASGDQYLQGKSEEIDISLSAPISYKSIANFNTSVGQGFGAHLLLGYNFNPTFGFEFDITYFISSPTRIEERSTVEAWQGNPPAGALSGPGIRYNEVSSKQIRVAPTVVIRGSGSRIRPIAKFGLLIPVGGSAKSVTVIDDPYLVSPAVGIFPEFSGITSTFQKATIDASIAGAFSVGFQSGIGAEIRLTDALDLRANAYYQGLRVKRESLTINSAEVELVEDLPNIDVMYLLNLGGAYEYTEYYDEIDVTTLDISAEDYGTAANPAKALREDGSYNNFGLDVGIIFNLGRRADEN